MWSVDSRELCRPDRTEAERDLLTEQPEPSRGRTRSRLYGCGFLSAGHLPCAEQVDLACRRTADIEDIGGDAVWPGGPACLR